MWKFVPRMPIAGIKIWPALCGLLASTSVAWAADVIPVKAAPPALVAPAPAWTVTAATEARYFSWRSSRGSPANATTSGGSGSQFYVPYAMQLTGQPSEDWKVSLLGRGGWVWARQSTSGLTGEVATTTDTVTSGTVTYLGFNGIQPFVSLNLNLPTGRSELFGSAANARMDGDLVEIGSFGEGFNIGPTVGFNLPVTNALMLTASAGYTRRGSFARERSTAETNPTLQAETTVDPGDVLTGTASIGYDQGPVKVLVTGSVSEESTTTESGVELYRAGRRYLASGAFSYAWPESWGQTTLTASVTHSNRNQVKFLGAATLVPEPFNTNSNLYRVGLQHLFPIDRLAIGPTGGFLLRDNNAYDATTLQFVPQKQRWSAGAIARYALNDAVTLNTRLEHIWTHESERPADGDRIFSVLANDFVAGSAVPTVSSTGWQAAIGVNAKF